MWAQSVGSTAEGEVVRFEYFLSDVWGRDDNETNRAELDGDERAVFLGELGEIDVGSGGVEVVEVSDDGKAWWTWWIWERRRL